MKKEKEDKMKIIILILSLFIFSFCYAEEINLSKIRQIESKNNFFAYNFKSKAIGLYQITPIVLQEYNKFNSLNIVSYQLFYPIINEQIAIWYLNKRIPQMLKYFNKPITVRNVLICYNAGILYVVGNKSLPKETINYIKKYNAIK